VHNSSQLRLVPTESHPTSSTLADLRGQPHPPPTAFKSGWDWVDCFSSYQLHLVLSISKLRARVQLSDLAPQDPDTMTGLVNIRGNIGKRWVPGYQGNMSDHQTRPESLILQAPITVIWHVREPRKHLLRQLVQRHTTHAKASMHPMAVIVGVTRLVTCCRISRASVL
jgi:hypothetical protein